MEADVTPITAEATQPSPDPTKDSSAPVVAAPDKPADQPVLVTEAATRRIWLCADDYGISPGVNDAIRDLLLRGRINATSVMVVAALLQPRRSDAAHDPQSRLAAARDRTACDADRAVPAAVVRLWPAAGRRFSAAQSDVARGDAAPDSSRRKSRSRSARRSRPSRPPSAVRPISSTAISTCTFSRRCARR